MISQNPFDIIFYELVITNFWGSRLFFIQHLISDNFPQFYVLVLYVVLLRKNEH